MSERLSDGAIAKELPIADCRLTIEREDAGQVGFPIVNRKSPIGNSSYLVLQRRRSWLGEG